MRILVIYQYYLMPGMPGGSRYNEFARMWSEAGHDVTVVTGNLDYSSGTVPERYRGRGVVEEWDGPVRVIRCPVPASYGTGYAGRAYAYLGFNVTAAIGVLRAVRPDVVIASSPPLLTAITGFLASRARWRRIPWVFEVRDLWPESAVTTGVLSQESPVTKALYVLERAACASADAISVLTPAFRSDIVERGLATSDKIHILPNGADLELFQPASLDQPIRRELGWDDRFVVMYAGAHGRANALTQLIEAAELLRNRSDILIACVGDGSLREELIDDVRRRGLKNIAFYGSFPKSRMPEIVNASNVGAAVLQNNPTFRTVYPNKVFDYMACNRPVLLAIDGVIRELVCDEARAGLFAEPENPDALASVILELADDAELREELGARGRAFIKDRLSRHAVAEDYLRVLEGVAGRPASASSKMAKPA